MDYQEMFECVCKHFADAHIEEYVEQLRWRPEEYEEFDSENFFDLPLFDLPDVGLYDAGCSKWVISFEDIPGWVIKVPFCGRMEFELDEDGYLDVDSRIFVEYKHADNDFGECWNYCQKEKEVYDAAKECGVESFFPKTVFLGSFQGLEIFAAERLREGWDNPIDCSYAKFGKTSEKIYKSCSKMNRRGELLPLGQIQKMVASGMDEKSIIKTILFLQEQEVGDFHDGNFGWDQNNCFKILDFSNFNE